MHTTCSPRSRNRRWLLTPEHAKQKFDELRAAVLHCPPGRTFLVQAEFIFPESRGATPVPTPSR